MDVVPWSWFLGQNQNYRIFQEKTGPEIIEEIFNEFSFSDYQNSCQGNFPKSDYCVQYQESSFNFETSGTNLQTSTNIIIDQPLVSDYETLVYAGGFRNIEDGRQLTDLRMM